jgi:hypothetical protein
LYRFKRTHFLPWNWWDIFDHCIKDAARMHRIADQSLYVPLIAAVISI